MKNMILFTLIMIVCKFNFACPVYHIGDIYVVNEKNEPLNVKVWRVWWSNLKKNRDSVLISKDHHWNRILQKYDSVNNRRCIYNYNNFGEIRFQAEGYADLVLKNFKFIYNYENENKPKLIVKMYRQNYYKIEKNISLISEYQCNKNIEIRDSMVIGISDYLKDIKETATIGDADNILLVESYPNPVQEQLNIEIHLNIKEPWSFQITSINGQRVLSKALTSSKTIIGLEEMPTGTYILVVYNDKGIVVYNRRFLVVKT